MMNQRKFQIRILKKSSLKEIMPDFWVTGISSKPGLNDAFILSLDRENALTFHLVSDAVAYVEKLVKSHLIQAIHDFRMDISSRLDNSLGIDGVVLEVTMSEKVKFLDIAPRLGTFIMKEITRLSRNWNVINSAYLDDMYEFISGSPSPFRKYYLWSRMQINNQVLPNYEVITTHIPISAFRKQEKEMLEHRDVVAIGFDDDELAAFFKMSLDLRELKSDNNPSQGLLQTHEEISTLFKQYTTAMGFGPLFSKVGSQS